MSLKVPIRAASYLQETINLKYKHYEKNNHSSNFSNNLIAYGL